MIFYLSCTGNTEWAAQELAKATGEQLVSIQKVEDGDCRFSLKEGERIGFCFPVHGWRPPLLVRNFVKKLKIENADNHFCYAVCTAGDDIGETIKILDNDLQNAGISLNSAWSLIMPESYVGLPFMDVDKVAKKKLKKETAAAQLAEYKKQIENRDKGVFNLTRGKHPKVNSRLLGAFFVNRLITDKPFKVDSIKCVKCGICADVCPVDNIKGGLGYEPEWKHNDTCLTCFACYHHCPHHAIEFGKRTKNKGQYYYKRNK